MQLAEQQYIQLTVLLVLGNQWRIERTWSALALSGCQVLVLKTTLHYGDPCIALCLRSPFRDTYCLSANNPVCSVPAVVYRDPSVLTGLWNYTPAMHDGNKSPPPRFPPPDCLYPRQARTIIRTLLPGLGRRTPLLRAPRARTPWRRLRVTGTTSSASRTHRREACWYQGDWTSVSSCGTCSGCRRR